MENVLATSRSIIMTHFHYQHVGETAKQDKQLMTALAEMPICLLSLVVNAQFNIMTSMYRKVFDHTDISVICHHPTS